jgi:predicted nucleotidyltransferase
VAQRVTEAVHQLEAYSGGGELADVCRRHRVELLVVFGSAAQGADDPRDLDLALLFLPGVSRDVLTLLDDLYALLGVEDIDVMVLNDAHVVARERALVHGTPVYQSRSGIFATQQIAAIMERLDTDHLRRLELELMAQ